MRRIILIMLLCASVPATSTKVCGQTPDPSGLQKQEAKREINEGARAYSERNYYEAQLHFERAMSLDPTQKNAPLFFARSIHAQYKPGDDSPENVAKARAAVAAYERVIDSDPVNDDAYNAIIYLYFAIKDDDAARQWITRRADDDRLSAEKRSESLTILASRDWQCSYSVTEQQENKLFVEKGNRVVLTYLMPKDRSDFVKAQQCAARGLETVDRAVALDQQSEQAWTFKVNLLLELAKLAEIENDADRAQMFRAQADEATRRVTALKEDKKKREADEKEKAVGSQRPPR